MAQWYCCEQIKSSGRLSKSFPLTRAPNARLEQGHMPQITKRLSKTSSGRWHVLVCAKLLPSPAWELPPLLPTQVPAGASPSHLACKSLLVQVDQVHLSAHHFLSLGFEIWNTRELWQKSLHCWCGWMESSEFTLLVTFFLNLLCLWPVFFQGLDWVDAYIASEECPLCQYKKSSMRTSDHVVSGWLDLM